MNKRKAIGLCILLLGITLAIWLTASQYMHCVDMWANEGKKIEFPSAMDYFFEISTGTILISGLIAGVSSFLGISICIQKKPF